MMNKKFWAPAWVVLYALAVAIGILRPASVIAHIVGIAFFLPPAMLLWIGNEKKEKNLVRGVRWLALASLLLTTATYVALFLSLKSQADLDVIMEALLAILAAPGLCFKAPAVGLFGWACLFYGSFVGKKSKK